MAQGGEDSDQEIEFRVYTKGRGRGSPLNFGEDIKPSKTEEINRWRLGVMNEFGDTEKKNTQYFTKKRSESRTRLSLGKEEQEVSNEENMFIMIQQLNERIDRMTEKSMKGQRVKIKPPKFDNSGSLLTFLAQFEICARRNKWSDAEKVDMLKCSLLGSTAQILWDMGTDKEDSFEEMVELLKQRFGTSGQAEAYRAQLRGKKQNKGESLSMLMTEIKRLMCLAYPGPTTEMGQIVARDAFIDALGDRQIAVKIREREPLTLDAAYQIAVRLEAYNQVTVGENSEERNRVHKMRGVEVRGVEIDHSQILEELLNTQKLMKQQLLSQAEKITELSSRSNEEGKQQGKGRGTVMAKVDRPKVICHKCNKEGHIRPYCPMWEEEKKERETKEKLVDKPKIGMIKERCGERIERIGKTLYVNLRIGTEMQECLIDTGSEVTIVPWKYVMHQQMQTTSRLLHAVNGTNVELAGKITIGVTVGDSIVPTEFLISKQVAEIILGLDWLMNHDCVLNFWEPSIVVKGYKIPLKRSKIIGEEE